MAESSFLTYLGFNKLLFNQLTELWSYLKRECVCVYEAGAMNWATQNIQVYLATDSADQNQERKPSVLFSVKNVSA